MRRALGDGAGAEAALARAAEVVRARLRALPTEARAPFLERIRVNREIAEAVGRPSL